MRTLFLLDAATDADGDSVDVRRRVSQLLTSSACQRDLRPADNDIRVYADRRTRQLMCRECPTVASSLIQPSMSEGTRLAKDERDGASLVEILNTVRRQFYFDVIVHWGENHAVQSYCTATGAARVVMGPGYTQEPFRRTVVFCPFGIAGASAPARVSFDDIESAVGSEGHSHLVDQLTWADDLDAVAYEDSFRCPRFDGVDRVLAQGRRMTAFVALPSDTTDLQQTSPFESLSHAVQSVVVPLVEAGYLCIIKQDRSLAGGSVSDRSANTLQKLLKTLRGSIIRIDSREREVTNQQLFALAECVVTVNSPIGFEALLHGKLVHVAGNAVYKPSGVFPSLTDLIAGNIDRAEYDRRIAVLRSYFLDAYLVDEREAFRYDTFTNRVTAAVAAHAASDGDPRHVIDDVYRHFGRIGAARRDAELRAGVCSKTSLFSAPVNAGNRPSVPVRLVRRLVSHLPASRQQRVLHTLRRLRTEWHLRTRRLSNSAGN